eukprot:6683879-Pyramimonas_sp.AAC.1
MGVAFGHALIGIQSFYDSICWVALAGKALSLGIPPVILFLELQLCLGPRVLAQLDCFSEALQPTGSAIQGLRRGARFARCMTYHILDSVSKDSPMVDI